MRLLKYSVFILILVAAPSHGHSADQVSGDNAAHSPVQEPQAVEDNTTTPPDDLADPNPDILAYGGKAALTLATFGGADADREFVESTYSLGLGINAFARLDIARTKRTLSWGFQAELAYTGRGSGSRVEGDDRAPFDFSYAELALLARAQWSLDMIDERIALHGVLGPSAGYLIAAKRDQEDTTDEAGDFDIGLHAGAGLSFELPFGAPLLEARYYHGFMNVFPMGTLELKHRAFSIFLGYEARL